MKDDSQGDFDLQAATIGDTFWRMEDNLPSRCMIFKRVAWIPNATIDTCISELKIELGYVTSNGNVYSISSNSYNHSLYITKGGLMNSVFQINVMDGGEHDW